MSESPAANQKALSSSPTRGAKPFKHFQPFNPARTPFHSPSVGTFVGILLQRGEQSCSIQTTLSCAEVAAHRLFSVGTLGTLGTSL